MDELIPGILSAVIGAIIWSRTSGRLRIGLSVCTVLVSGASATLLSLEYVNSWIYFLFDLATAALGLAAGIAMTNRLSLSRRDRNRALLTL